MTPVCPCPVRARARGTPARRGNAERRGSSYWCPCGGLPPRPYPYPYPGPAVGASGRQGVRASDLARSGPGQPVGPRREEHLAADRETAGGAEDQLGLAADVGQADLHAEAHGEGGGAELVSPHVDV